MSDLLVEKYRPKTLDQYIFQDASQKTKFEEMVREKKIPHLLLSGVQGTGKTCISEILVSELGIDDSDVLVVNASDENSVDTMREKIKNFVSTCGFDGMKIVRLEEADYITPNGQAVLRRLMEEFASNARFILTCNYENKIIPPIKSRTQHFKFKTQSKDDVIELVAKILLKEKVKFDLDVLERYVGLCHPDIRKTLNFMQQHIVGNQLIDTNAQSESGDYKFAILDLLEKDRWTEIRTVLCENVSGDEWEEIYRFMYENVDKSAKFKNKNKWEEAILIIAEHLHKHALVADPEINAAAMFIRLGQV